MSHIATLKVNVNLTNKKYLTAAIKDIQKILNNELNVVENGIMRRAIYIKTFENADQCDYIIRPQGHENLTLGLKYNPQTKKYDILIDKWAWDVHNKNYEKFINKLNDFYLLEETKEKLEEQGYNVDWNYDEIEEEINLIAEQW